jgi:hypothetical protein
MQKNVSRCIFSLLLLGIYPAERWVIVEESAVLILPPHAISCWNISNHLLLPSVTATFFSWEPAGKYWLFWLLSRISNIFSLDSEILTSQDRLIENTIGE